MEENGKHRVDQCGFHYPDCAGGSCDCDERKYGSYGSGGGISTFGAILLTVGSFILTIFIISLFSSDVDDVPAGVILILFILVTSVVGGVVGTFKK